MDQRSDYEEPNEEVPDLSPLERSYWIDVVAVVIFLGALLV